MNEDDALEFWLTVRIKAFEYQSQLWLTYRAHQMQREIRLIAEQHQRDMRDFIRFQNRSIGQIRRFQVASRERME